ncbi:cinnamoyl-CoA reductase 1 isoform X2 [Lolium perenne]|uniref:cinnamoyl-CoA reductase 1 isoform X2 n=1 Tax=Lolium perenne TaxID=4522 RepID=UPI0021F6891B|nr:cinnamoyl-CoA reductase 1-like isoform X2 [Lolium perenne]
MTGVEKNTESGKTVCVTGAGGFIGSWLVKLLLSRGYTVHGTVRDLGDSKTSYLRRLDNAADKLKLLNADLLDNDAMAAAIAGCQGVFHVATPVPSEKITDPEAASAANVRRVVVVSSMVAVEINPKDWPHGKIRDESCWSDQEFCRSIESWYPVAKIAAEAAALEYGRETGLDVVTLNPSLVFGPMLQPTVNTSNQFLIYFLKGGPDLIWDKLWHIIDVRDVAEALLLLYEAPGAAGRHICAPHFITARELLALLKSMYPGYPYIAEDSIRDMDHPARMTSGKLEKLGWSCRTMRDTITDAVDFCREAGFLEDAVDGAPCRFPPLLNKI